MFMFGSNANFARVFGRHDAPGKVTIKSRQGKIQSRMHADGRENAAWTPRCLRLFADGVVDNPGPIANVLPLARALVSLLQPAQPLGLLLACSPCVKSLLRHQCGAVAAADTTCMVALPWHSVPRPEVPLCRLPGPQGPDRGGGFLHAHVLCLKPRTRVPRLPRSPAPVVSGWPVLLL
jgi:hypothetical protein